MMKCCIVKDLLPNYIDGLTSEEANEEIREHLESCEDCRRACALMSASIPAGVDEDMDFLKKMRKRLWRYLGKRYAAIILLTCILSVGLTSFVKGHGFPIPYDPDCMTTESYQAVPVVGRTGTTRWEDLDTLDLETSEAVMEGAHDTARLVRLVITGPARWDGFRSVGRTLERGGEKVRVVYYCYTRTLWDRISPDRKTSLDRMSSTGAIYGMRLYRAEYEPVMTEIYYLSMGGWSQMEWLSDEAFDARRGDAILVWSGMN